MFKRPKLIVNSTKNSILIEESFLKYFPNALNEQNPDVLVPIGGDGTVLYTLKHFGDYNIPIFAIANGTLNFIPNEIKNYDDFFSKLVKEEIKLELEKTFNMNITLIKDNVEVCKKAVNDIVLGNGIMDFFHFNIGTEDKTFENKRISAGGICITSPLGSTAYHYNNNGMIIPSLNLPLFGITTIVSNKKDQINKLINAEKVSISLDGEQRDNCLIFIDGKTNILEFKKGDKLEITKGNEIEFYFIDLKAFKIKRLTH